MKILPDSMRCHVAKMADGLPWALPKILERIPRNKLDSRWRPFLMPALLLGVSAAAFADPRVLIALVPACLVFSWRIGSCPHCEILAVANEDSVDAGRPS